MDFGIGFLTNNIMLPILDFFYGIVPSYGLAIVALTLLIRFALYPLNAGSIRNMRRMKITQPLMQKKVKEIQERYKDDPAKLQEEMGGVYKEFGNPLAGCFPVVLQMPILFALFATLRGSPFADITYPVNLQILPQDSIEQVQPQAFSAKQSNLYIADGKHFSIAPVLPGGNRIGVGDSAVIRLQTPEGESVSQLADKYAENPAVFTPIWEVTKGQDLVKVDENGQITALALGDVTIQAKVKGLAANKGFLFIKELGRIGALGDEGEIHWDILGMILFFGVSLYVNQLLSGQSSSDNPQQETITKLTPVLFSGMFLFFPLPAGVLLYMVLANVFQTAQSFILSREPLPDNIQALVDAEEVKTASADRGPLAFEPGAKKAADKGKSSSARSKSTSKTSAKNNKSTNKATSSRSKGNKKSGGSSKKKVSNR
ncbi:membrane protein insertase YidC [Leptolyngbyaceae cyanobacterium CCMR0082]|uniref:Membrane protein insertase YidC n=2 Tax=Adonisia turfae TaxID=2950184 RepID=A0A6M0S991_9CYAN|nr:membrane protein insertase YidC [Adonisia turfae]MDV3352312.1 membrane protein insertase YidC [Leptothoe sp. LEGE 181152]NEZ54721.1 membrane protein insertase YidC [Adonisia turfae CCMR0081]NEZ65000.1 membrane protein insertase YidC [Adonisia turfae CCMR0082]